MKVKDTVDQTQIRHCITSFVNTQTKGHLKVAPLWSDISKQWNAKSLTVKLKIKSTNDPSENL